MWLPEKRYAQILTLLESDGIVKTSDLRKRIGVSFETIRRDLEHLEAIGRLRRTHGGAVAADSIGADAGTGYLSFHQRERQNVAQKTEVAQLAAQFIVEGQSLALDSGTTSRRLAEIIKTKFNNLTVVTNSLYVANELADAKGFTIILTGGVLQADEFSLTSDMATLIFSKLNIDTFFLTTCGVSVECGVTYQRTDEILVQNKMLETSGKTILITDSSKLGTNSLYTMCSLDKISLIITDSSVTQEQIDMFERVNIPVIHPQNVDTVKEIL